MIKFLIKKKFFFNIKVITVLHYELLKKISIYLLKNEAYGFFYKKEHNY